MGDAKRSLAWRGLLAVALAVSLPLLVALSVVLAVLLDIVLVIGIGESGTGNALTYKVVVVAIGATIALVVVLVRLVVPLLRSHRDPVEHELPVTRAEEPELWAAIDAAAVQAGVRGPDVVALMSDVNAAVFQTGGLLSRGGERHLVVGVPLMAAVDVRGLCGVIAHELGHFSGGDTRLGGIQRRTIESYRATLRELPVGSVRYRMVHWWGGQVFKLSSKISRRQELAADRAAADATSAAELAQALTWLQPADGAYSFLLNRYVSPLLEQGCAPANVYDGLRALLQSPARLDELEAVKARALEQAPGEWDSHPTLAQRLAALQVPVPRLQVPEHPGRSLLRDPDARERQMSTLIATRILGPDPVLVEWDAAAERMIAPILESGRRAFAETAGSTLLELADVVARAEPIRDDRAAAAVGRFTYAAFATALISSGRANPRLSWDGPVELVDRRGTVVPLHDRVDEVVRADSPADAFRALVRRMRLTRAVPVAVVDAPDREDVVRVRDVARWHIVDVLIAGGRHGKTYDCFITTDHLYAVLTGEGNGMLKQLLSHVFGGLLVSRNTPRALAERKERIRQRLALPEASLAALPGTITIAWSDVKKARPSSPGNAKQLRLKVNGRRRKYTLTLPEGTALSKETRQKLFGPVLGSRLTRSSMRGADAS